MLSEIIIIKTYNTKKPWTGRYQLELNILHRCFIINLRCKSSLLTLQASDVYSKGLREVLLDTHLRETYIGQIITKLDWLSWRTCKKLWTNTTVFPRMNGSPMNIHHVLIWFVVKKLLPLPYRSSQFETYHRKQENIVDFKKDKYRHTCLTTKLLW